jgi:hypothetical protein
VEVWLTIRTEPKSDVSHNAVSGQCPYSNVLGSAQTGAEGLGVGDHGWAGGAASYGPMSHWCFVSPTYSMGLRLRTGQ